LFLATPASPIGVELVERLPEVGIELGHRELCHGTIPERHVADPTFTSRLLKLALDEIPEVVVG